MLVAYRQGGEIRIDHGACLSLDPTGIACKRCDSACPVDAILVTAEGPKISRDCLGCGRCAALCPTAALEIDAFVARAESNSGRDAVVVACHRVTKVRGGPPSVVVRCLAALSPADWMEVILDADTRPITLIDPGVCSTCPAGGMEAPWAVSLADASRLMQAAGLPRALVPVVLRTTRHEVEEMPEPGKRRLLSFIAPLATRVVHSDSGTKRPFAKRQAGNVRRQAIALRAMSARIDGCELAMALPRATVTAACDGCGVCVAVCPTPALQLLDVDDGIRELSFEGAECVQCRSCEAICPKRAISMAAQGSTGERTVIRSLVLQDCKACDEPFAPQSDETLCPICRRSAALASSDLFHRGEQSDPPTLTTAIYARE